MQKKILGFVVAFVLAASGAQAGLLNFNDLRHGEIVTDQYLASHGVTISAVNPNRSHDLAIAFNTNLTGTLDPDLEYPWVLGNLSNPQEALGMVLIIAETGALNSEGLVANPSDEGRRPAGQLFFDFDTPLLSVGFDLVDVEGPEEYGKDSGYVAVFYQGDTEVGRVGFGQFIDPLSIFYDSTVQYGDNSANRIQPIYASQFGGDYFTRVEFNLGGSAGIDNIRYSVVPEPMTISLFGMGLAGVLMRRRRKTVW